MKQKYTIHKDPNNKKLVIQEYAELDKEILSLLCEETYDEADVTAAINMGTDALINSLRTRNMYPPSAFASKIAESVAELYRTQEEQHIDLLFDDKEFFEKETEIEDSENSVDSEAEEMDELLEDDIDDVYEDKNLIKNLKSSLKVADDESVNSDEDT